MTRNVGTTDRVVRIVLGLAIIVAGFVYGTLWGLLGVPLLATGLAGSCGLYSVLGMSTCKTGGSRTGKG